VGVDVEVALDLDPEVESAVLPELVEHVVVEADAGGDLHGPVGAVQVKVHVDAGLTGRAGDVGGAAHWFSFSAGPAGRGSASNSSGRSPMTVSKASRKAVVSSSVPAVTRRRPGRPTSLTR